MISFTEILRTRPVLLKMDLSFHCYYLDSDFYLKILFLQVFFLVVLFVMVLFLQVLFLLVLFLQNSRYCFWRSCSFRSPGLVPEGHVPSSFPGCVPAGLQVLFLQVSRSYSCRSPTPVRSCRSPAANIELLLQLQFLNS